MDQLRQCAVFDADLAQGLQGVLGIVACAAKAADGVPEDLAQAGIAQGARVARVLVWQRESQRPHGAVRCGAGQPAWLVNRHGHLARPQTPQHILRSVGRNPVNHASTTATPQQSEDQARALGAAAVDTAPHLQGAVPAVHARQVGLQGLELRTPDQRGIAKHPKVLPGAVLCLQRIERACDGHRLALVRGVQHQTFRMGGFIFGDKDMSNQNDNQPVVWAVLVAVIILAVGLALGFGIAKSKKPAVAPVAAAAAAPAAAASEAAPAASEASAAK